MENINRGFNWTRGTPDAVNNRFWNMQNKYPLSTAFNKTMDQKEFLASNLIHMWEFHLPLN
jgi:hypothetical protein